QLRVQRDDAHATRLRHGQGRRSGRRRPGDRKAGKLRRLIRTTLALSTSVRATAFPRSVPAVQVSKDRWSTLPRQAIRCKIDWRFLPVPTGAKSDMVSVMTRRSTATPKLLARADAILSLVCTCRPPIRFGLDAVSLRCRQAHSQQHLGHLAQRSEARVLGQSVVIAVINLLNDHRHLEQREDVIEKDVADVAPGFLVITLD